MTVILALGVLILMLGVAAILLLVVLKGINLNINVTHTHNIPELPQPVEIKQEEDDSIRSVMDAAQAIQQFFLNDDQIDRPEVK